MGTSGTCLLPPPPTVEITLANENRGNYCFQIFHCKMTLKISALTVMNRTKSRCLLWVNYNCCLIQEDN